MVRVSKLDSNDEAALEECLSSSPTVNLFLRKFLAEHPIHHANWYGVRDGDRVVSTALTIPGRITVPYCTKVEHAAAIGTHLARVAKPTMMVGPREAVDAIWTSWAPGVNAIRHHEQRLFECIKPNSRVLPTLSVARMKHFVSIRDAAAEMELEDLGLDPRTRDLEAHNAAVQLRISQKRTFVSYNKQGALEFLVHVGLQLPDGCQLGGTYVPPAFRGRSVATNGISSVVTRLLKSHKRVTLHVNEKNTAAITVYERCGFIPTHAFRLICV